MSGILPDDVGVPVAAERRTGQHLARQAEMCRRADTQTRVAGIYQRMADDLELILGDALKDEIASDYSPATKRAYAADIKRFKQWCVDDGLSYLPAEPETVASFLIVRAGDDEVPLRAIVRIVSAIGYLHQLGQFPNPADDVLVRATLRWLRARYAEAKKGEPKQEG